MRALYEPDGPTLVLSQASQEIKLFALEYHHNNIIQSSQFVGNEAIGMHK